MTEIIVNSERTFIKYKKRMERELSRLRIENNVAVMLRDMEKGIGELVERERQRNLTASYTHLIMENSSDYFILLDDQLRLLAMSHNFKTQKMKVLEPGTDVEDLIKAMLGDRYTPEAAAATREGLSNVEKQGITVKQSVSNGEGDEIRYFDMTATGVSDAASGRKGVVLTFSESTALVRAVQAAESADKAKSAFLANMSHEIRTPINAIVGMSAIALERGGISDELAGNLTTIQNAASGLLGIINDILDFSKIESGKFQIVPTDYELSSVLMDICNVISVKLQSSTVRLLMMLDANLPVNLYGDDIRVKQILINLLNNAVKFTKTGFVELKVEGERLPGDQVKLVLKVIDSGIGIKKEDLNKLFRTFSQVDTQRNRAITGTGLGLAISRNLAEAMGGGITVDSEYGSGSTFTVTIIQGVRDDKPIGSVKQKDKVRMLVVDDDELLVDIVGKTLDNLGIEWQVCHYTDRLRSFENFTHVLLQRKNYDAYREKLEFMFKTENIYLIIDQNEMAAPEYMPHKQLQLPLLAIQLINALNGDEIVSSIKKAGFKRTQIVPLTYAKVLIVDDNLTNLQVAKGLMSPYKMQLDTATSGYKAIEMVRKTNYDAIFMDHMMPEMDGVEATQYIRKLEGDYFKSVPIIALTANAMSDARDMFLSSGMDDFISKPIEIQELHRVIKKYIESKAPEGYMASARKAIEQEAAVKAKNEAAKAVKSPAAPAVSAPAAQTLNFAPADGNMLTGLLQQNNMLLSQNSVLLSQLLNMAGVQSPAAPVMPAMPAMPAAPVPSEPAPAAEPAAEQAPESEDEDSIPGVNMEAAIEGCGGSKEIYDEILATYSADLKGREQEVKSLYAAKDIKGFTIVVHALKSASRSIGAADLGEAAFSLEKHGKAEEWSEIEKEYPAFMEALADMGKNVERYVSKHCPPKQEAPTEGKEAKPGFDSEAIERLQTACADMDYMQAEDILHEMDNFDYPAQQAEALAQMLKACADFEYDRLETLVKELKPDA